MWINTGIFFSFIILCDRTIIIITNVSLTVFSVLSVTYYCLLTVVGFSSVSDSSIKTLYPFSGHILIAPNPLKCTARMRLNIDLLGLN